MAELRPSGRMGVWEEGRRLYTRNLVPGQQVYGERLVVAGGFEYREWNPRRSKLAAALLKGLAPWPLHARSRVLYLGAAQGTTASHVSDIAAEGLVYAIEVSPRAFRQLLQVGEDRRNLIPILADARAPDRYASLVEPVDVLYADVAQRDQVDIVARNLGFLRPGGHGLFMVKARSIDVAAPPASIYRQVQDALVARGLEVLQSLPLDPQEKDHAAVLFRKAAA